MANKKAINQADMNDEDISIEDDFDALEICHANHQQTHSYQERESLLTEHMLPQECPFTADSSQSPLLALPAEIRNVIYAMVLADLPDIIGFEHRPIGDFSLRQPALARVNRQLRHEILPMFYFEKNFGVRIYPKAHSEVDQVWQGFLDRFAALKTGIGGISHLSYIRRLEVELWHPAFKLSEPKPPRYNEDEQFTLALSQGVYLQFGLPISYETRRERPGTLPIVVRHGRRVGNDDTDWADRDAVRNLLGNAIVRAHGNPFAIARGNPFTGTHGGLYPRTLQRFRSTYPYERLVDLAMMIAAECKQLTSHVQLEASFLHWCHLRRS